MMTTRYGACLNSVHALSITNLMMVMSGGGCHVAPDLRTYMHHLLPILRYHFIAKLFFWSVTVARHRWSRLEKDRCRLSQHCWVVHIVLLLHCSDHKSNKIVSKALTWIRFHSHCCTRWRYPMILWIHLLWIHNIIHMNQNNFSLKGNRLFIQNTQQLIHSGIAWHI